MNAPRPVHAPMTQFAVVDDCLRVGGAPAHRARAARGPHTVLRLRRQLITQRVEHLRKNLPASVHLHYAIKANPMPEVVSHLATLVDGLDVASGGELRVALESGMSPSEISFAGQDRRGARAGDCRQCHRQPRIRGRDGAPLPSAAAPARGRA